MRSTPTVRGPRDCFEELAQLRRAVDPWRAHERALAQLKQARELLDEVASDPELSQLAKEDVARFEREAATAWAKLSPPDDVSLRAAIVEITAGVGGDEAALFVETLFSMYLRHARARGWEVVVDDEARALAGGLRAVRFFVEGEGAYARLRHESGTHRVQRFSETAARDVMHTSAAAVVVLPDEPDPEVVIRKADVRKDTFSAGGPGGQHVNKSTSACRLIHEPTGIVVQCQDERSLGQNLARAWRTLAARVAEHARLERERENDERRRTLRGQGTRCEKIRTYNYPQDRVTDHRVPVTIHGLDAVLGGKLDGLLDALVNLDEAAR